MEEAAVNGWRQVAMAFALPVPLAEFPIPSFALPSCDPPHQCRSTSAEAPESQPPSQSKDCDTTGL